jgi:hypothetical protein
MIVRQPVALTKTALSACLAGGLAMLGACSTPVGCSADYRGGCVPETVSAVPATPAAAIPGASPAAVIPAASPAGASPAATRPAGTSPAATSPAAVRLGDPSEFADLDDKQCRSYGLTFGTRDYADCRIRLSAQHRGLDPNIGTTPNR